MAGVGAVIGFVPQMVILFLMLSFLEGCGYMARVAFIMASRLPQVRIVRQELHSHAHRIGLRCSRRHGHQDH
ncbi:MAG: hypothetical protein ACLT98_05755 [Eggerthellaceae bacterium]